MSRLEAVIAPASMPPPCSNRPQTGLERLEAALEAVRRQCPALPVLAIRWMHLKHPVHPVQLRLLREHLDAGAALDERTKPRPGGLTRWIRPRLMRRIAQCLLYACYLSGRLLRLHLVLRRDVAALTRQSFDVLIKTCCFAAAPPPDGSDFYFGDLQRRLTQRGVRTLLLCGNVRGGNWTAFALAYRAAPPLARMSELALLSAWAPFRLMQSQLRACFRLRRMARSARDPLITHIGRLASHECFAPDTTRAGLYFWIMRAAIRAWRPRAFVTLYEGHAWEVCARWGVKAEDASCRTVGYQHTAVFPESLSMTAPSTATAVRVMPDIVLGLGQVPLDLMAAGHARAKTRLIRFGSFRYHRADADRPADHRRRVILVTPEGILSEAQQLFEFTWACAQRLPDYTFLLRCHPEVPIANILRMLSVDLTAQPNIQISDRRLIEEDFARSSALLYRGSSTVLYAVLHGLLPLYVHLPTMLDRDSLHHMAAWRQRCTSPDDVAEQLGRYEQAPMERLEAEWANAVQYVKDYTAPVGDEQIEAFLAAIGLENRVR